MKNSHDQKQTNKKTTLSLESDGEQPRVSKHITIFSYRVEMALTSNQSRLAIKK